MYRDMFNGSIKYRIVDLTFHIIILITQSVKILIQSSSQLSANFSARRGMRKSILALTTVELELTEKKEINIHSEAKFSSLFCFRQN